MVLKGKKTKKPKRAQKVSITLEPSRRNPNASLCFGCPGTCCSLYPELTVYDVFRLALSQSKPLSEYMILHYTHDDDAIPISISGKNVKMTIIHEDSKCVFFDDNSELKCSIQEDKPGICLAYPYVFLDNRLNRVPCPKINLERLTWTEEQDRLMIDSRWELDRHKEIASDWNATSGGEKDLGEFLKFAAREIEYEKTPWGSAIRKIKRVFRKR